MPGDLHAFAVGGMPEVSPGDDVGRLIVDAVARSGRSIADGDVVVVAQKIVSKAEGALIALAGVRPSSRAERWAEAFGKDPRVVEVVLRESRRIVRMERGIIIAETRHGFVCANAGVAELVTGKACRTPVAIVRGAAEWAGRGVGTMLVREASIDLFR